VSPEYIESKIPEVLSLSKRTGRYRTVIKPLTAGNAEKEAKAQQDFHFVSDTTILKVYYKKKTSRTLCALLNARFTKLQGISSTTQFECLSIDRF